MTYPGIRLSLVMALVVAFFAFALGCNRPSGQATRYHCPMHPTYVADRPADCPICGMRLVPIQDGTNGKSLPSSGSSPPPPSLPPTSSAPASAPSPGPSASAGVTVWTCPMDPEVVSDHPGKCPKCKMRLEPKVSPGAPPANTAGYAPFDVPQEGLRMAGVRLAVAERARLARTVRAAGIVRPDETRVRRVQTKVGGWVDKLHLEFTGQPVAKGQPILSVYSQELLATQQEYVRAREALGKARGAAVPGLVAGAEEMVAAARKRLSLYDVPEKAIAALDQGGEPTRTVTLLAPTTGIVTAKDVFEGQKVEPGMTLFVVSDLSRVWIEAELYENEAAGLRTGQKATITLPADPAHPREGQVKYIYPYLNPDTRTLKVRFDVPNPELSLRLDTFVTVEFPLESDEGVIVPDSAILDTGVRKMAFVSPTDGRFEPRSVTVGLRADGKVQVLSGLSAGERVAVKANFLLDAESRLRASLSEGHAP